MEGRRKTVSYMPEWKVEERQWKAEGKTSVLRARGRDRLVQPADELLRDPVDLKGTQPEVIRAIWCSGSAFYHTPR